MVVAALGVVLAVGTARGEAAAGAAKTNAPVLSACEVGYPPFSIVREDGAADGFSVELLRAALRAMNREVTFRTGPWAEVRGWLERGEVAALPLVGRTPEREALFDFTVPYMTMHGAIVCREDRDDIHELSDLRGRRVAVLAGDNAEEFLRREDRGLEIVTRPTLVEAFRDVASGACDAAVLQRLVAVRLLNETGLKGLRIVRRPVEGFTQDFCFAVREGDRDTLALLNEGLALIVADGTHRRLHARWFAALELPTDRRIVIGGDRDYPPYEFLDDRGRPAGLAVELTRAIAEAVGIEVEIRLGTWSEVVQALERGEIDAVQGMFYTEERSRKIDFSQPYLVSHYVSVVRADSGKPPETLQELANRKLVVQEGDAVVDHLERNGLMSGALLVSTQEAVLRAVASGAAECGVAIRIGALRTIAEQGLTGLKLGTHPLWTMEYCYAVPKGSKAVLAQFGEGLELLDRNGELRRLHEKWLGGYESAGMSTAEVMKAIALVAGPLLAVALLALLWSWGLRRQVARRTAELSESVEFQRAMIACSPVALYSTDLAGTVLAWNASAERMFGWTVDEALGKPLPIVPDELRAEIAALRERISQGGGFVGRELTRRRKDGTRFPVSLSIAPIRGADGSTVAIMSAAEDITERRRSEEALRRIEWMLTPGHRPEVDRFTPAYGDLTALNTCRTILDAVGAKALKDIVRDYLDLLETSAAVYEINGDYACGIFASGWCRLLDAASRRLCATADNAQALADGRWHCHKSCWSKSARRAIESGAPVDVECEGGLRLYAVPIRADGETIGVVDFGYGDPPRDPAVLRELAARFGLGVDELVEAARAYETRPPYIVEMAKARIEASARLIGEIVVRSRAQERIAHLNRILRAMREVDQVIVREQDEGRLIQMACDLMVRHRGYRGALIVLTDEQERITRRAQAGMDAIFAPLAVWLDTDRLPPCFAETRDGRAVHIVADPEKECPICPVARDCRGSGVMCARLMHGDAMFGYLGVVGDVALGLDGEEKDLFLEVAGDLGFALHSIATDAARLRAEREREAAQQQLIQAQKVESIGRLAGGVAHDFNNLLMGIMSYVELCRDKIGGDHPIRGYLDEIMQDARRSADLTGQLLAFARKQTIAPKVLDLNDTMEGMLKLLRRLIGEDIDLVWAPGAGVWPVRMDPGQLDQVLANLCVNARDAIGGVGRITIETANAAIDADYCTTHAEATLGEYVALVVSDDGHGMDSNVLAHLFEPFFTTKGVGEGTGLGLATVYGIVKQNDGFVNVYSEPGKGTTFRIYLPRVEGQAEASGEVVPTGAAQPPGGRETILVVEDEKSIRITLQRFLEPLGYVVFIAATPADALRQAAELAGEIDLLITDVVMPGLSGRELAGRLAASRPSMKCLYISGYTANVIAHRGILDEGVNFLAKPFTRDDIAKKVRDVLGGA